MNDRFKFRHWDKRINKMFYPERNDNFGYYVNNSDIIETMQCTGLKDKNGKLIYEGDIITDGIENYVVVWIDDDDHLGFYVRDLDNVHYTFYQLLEYTIIGNVYQNPELLEDNNG